MFLLMEICTHCCKFLPTTRIMTVNSNVNKKLIEKLTFEYYFSVAMMLLTKLMMGY